MLTLIAPLVIGLTDLVAAFLFLFGLKRMSSPATAPSGIRLAGYGMIAAVLVSFLYVFSIDAAARPHLVINLVLAVVALGIGGAGAWFAGRKVAMTAMPQMVAIYNGMGGGAAGAIAAVELFGGRTHGVTQLAVTLVGGLIGGVGAWLVGRKVAMTAMPQMVAIYNGMGGGAAGSIAAVELFGGHTTGVTQLVVTLLGGLIGAVSLSGSVIACAKLDGVMKKPLRV